jgi:Fe-Mn family superoxide dismutase
MTEQITLVPLPYALDALVPTISPRLLDYHYGTIAKTYVDVAKDSTDSYTKQDATYAAVLHNRFFEQLIAPKHDTSVVVPKQEDLFTEVKPYPDSAPFGASEEIIIKGWETFEKFQAEVEALALSMPTNGWIYMDSNGNIFGFINNTLPVDPQQMLLLIDLWEHAWEIDYQSNKTKYLKNIWKIINWQVVNERFTKYDTYLRQAALRALSANI